MEDDVRWLWSRENSVGVQQGTSVGIRCWTEHVAQWLKTRKIGIQILLKTFFFLPNYFRLNDAFVNSFEFFKFRWSCFEIIDLILQSSPKLLVIISIGKNRVSKLEIHLLKYFYYTFNILSLWYVLKRFLFFEKKCFGVLSKKVIQMCSKRWKLRAIPPIKFAFKNQILLFCENFCTFWMRFILLTSICIDCGHCALGQLTPASTLVEFDEKKTANTTGYYWSDCKWWFKFAQFNA